MEILRTPDERFENLPGYPFRPRYVEVPADAGRSLRVHYVDEGSGETVLLLHGEPSWSYLYRKVIPILVDAGYRAVAPDLIGFGRSDKIADRNEYTFARHVEWTSAALDAIGLDGGVTLFGQDWGSLIGLRLVGEQPERFARVAIGNGGLPTGDQPIGEAFLAWQRFSQEVPELPVGAIVQNGCVTRLSPEVVAAYDAPFPDERYKEGARQFPLLVPTSPDDPASVANRGAWETLTAFERPFLTCFSDSDPITSGAERILQAAIPGAKGQAHITIQGAGHFLQEDRGQELGRVLVKFLRSNQGASRVRR